MVAVLPSEYAAGKYNPVGRLSRLTDISLTLTTQIPAVLKNVDAPCIRRGKDGRHAVVGRENPVGGYVRNTASVKIKREFNPTVNGHYICD